MHSISWKLLFLNENFQEARQQHALDMEGNNGNISLGGPNHDSYISSNCAAGQFWVEWFLLTSAYHRLALSVQTIHVACWQQLPSGAAGDRPDADLLPVCWRRGGERFGLGGEGEDKGSNEEGRASWQLFALPDSLTHTLGRVSLGFSKLSSHTVWVKGQSVHFLNCCFLLPSR